MKRALFKNMSYAIGLTFLSGLPSQKFALVSSVDNSELNRLLRIVFSSEKDVLPKGAVGMLTNANCDPQILAFIKQNIMYDTSQYAMPALPDGLSEDDALAMSRQFGESREDYAYRLRSELEEFHKKVANLKSKKDEAS